MGRNRFVTPETVRLDLTDGDWIEVKRDLTFAEREQITAAAFSPSVAGPEIGINWATAKIKRMLVWLVDWSFVDARGKSVAITQDSLGALDGETADEIEAAINGHVEARAAEKKAMAGKTSSEV